MGDTIIHITNEKKLSNEKGIHCIDGNHDIIEILVSMIIEKVKEC